MPPRIAELRGSRLAGRLLLSPSMPVTRSVLAVLLATGCGTTVTATTLNPSPKPMAPRSPDSVELFSSAPPARPYVDVAYLEAEQDSDLSADRTGAFVAHLRERAAAMGCDGVILGEHTNRPSVSTSDMAFDVADALSSKPQEPPPDYGVPVNLRGLTATCIVYIPAPGELEAIHAANATAYDACRHQRIQILRHMQALPKADDRAKLLHQLPTCVRPAT